MIEAERAFAALAQAKGQWTAFRAYAAPDATMFVPQPVKAQDYLNARADPPTAVAWSPTAAFVSCDGRLAVAIGEWHAPYARGYFSTVWRRERDGRWRWIVDGGDTLQQPRAKVSAPPVRRAACSGSAPQIVSVPADAASATGEDAAGSLIWKWTVTPVGKRTFSVELRNGRAYETVIDDHIAAPPVTPPPPPPPAKP